MKQLANILTWILHPVILIILSVYLIVYSRLGEVNASFLWTGISMFFVGIISIFVLFGVKKGFFNNIDVSNRRQRLILYPFSIFIVAMFSLTVYLLKGPGVLIQGSVLVIIALLLLDVINRRIKASVHVGTVAAVATGLSFGYGGMLYLTLILIPLVAWARILEKRHTLKETVAGALCGILMTLGAFFVVQFI